MNIGLIGRGFVGDALFKSFKSKGVSLSSYDKHKKIGKFSADHDKFSADNDFK